MPNFNPRVASTLKKGSLEIPATSASFEWVGKKLLLHYDGGPGINLGQSQRAETIAL